MDRVGSTDALDVPDPEVVEPDAVPGGPAGGEVPEPPEAELDACTEATVTHPWLISDYSDDGRAACGTFECESGGATVRIELGEGDGSCPANGICEGDGVPWLCSVCREIPQNDPHPCWKYETGSERLFEGCDAPPGADCRAVEDDAGHSCWLCQ